MNTKTTFLSATSFLPPKLKRISIFRHRESLQISRLPTEFSCCCRGCSCHQIQLWARHAHKWWIAVAHIHRWFLSLLLLTPSFSFSSFLNCIFLPSRLLLCQVFGKVATKPGQSHHCCNSCGLFFWRFSAMGCLLKKRKPSLVSISIQKSCQKTDSVFFLNDWLFLWCPCSFSDDFFIFFLWCQHVLADNSFFCHLCRQVTLEFMMWPRNKTNRNMM